MGVIRWDPLLGARLHGHYAPPPLAVACIRGQSAIGSLQDSLRSPIRVPVEADQISGCSHAAQKSGFEASREDDCRCCLALKEAGDLLTQRATAMNQVLSPATRSSK
jgi:hypothetical protein